MPYEWNPGNPPEWLNDRRDDTPNVRIIDRSDFMNEGWGDFNRNYTAPRTNQDGCGIPFMALLCICLIWLAKAVRA